MSPETQPTPSETGQIAVLLVDNWLVFDCPGCDQTIKIDRENAAFEIQCPSCELGLAPLLKFEDQAAEEVIGDTEGSTHHRRSSRPRIAPPQSAPTADDLPQEGQVTLEIALSPPKTKPSAARGLPTRKVSPRSLPSRGKKDSGAFNPTPSSLPVRSDDDLESRRLSVAPLHPPTQSDEDFSSVIEEGGGGQYKRIRVRTRKKRANEKSRALRFYLLAFVGAILLAAGAFYLAALAAQRSDDNEKEEALAQSIASPMLPQGPVIDDWKVLIQQMIEADDWEDLLNLVRKPKRVSDRMAAYYAERDLYPDIVDATLETTASSRDLPSGFRRGQLRLSGKSMIFYLENTSSHGYRLDWESFVGAGSMLWPEFQEERPTTPQRMRVIASLADYYEGMFSDSNRFQSVRLEDASGQHTLYTFLRRGSPTDRDFLDRLIGRDLMRESSIRLQVVLDLRFPADATSDVQVEIVDYVSDRWLIP